MHFPGKTGMRRADMSAKIPVVLGIANILPLDHTYVVSRPLEDAINWLRSNRDENPSVGFDYSSYQRSGGGRIANILAYLGTHGHIVSAVGVIGDDAAAGLVL